MQAVKESARQVIDNMQESCSWDDLKNGRVVSHEDVRRMVDSRRVDAF